MGLLKTVFQRETIFPENISNEYINAMPRGELTEEQKAKPYAKYYYKDMAPIPQADLDAANAGPVDLKLNLPLSRAAEVLNEGYLEMETGYGLLEDGSAVAATKVFMPGVTPEMIDWWFNWHPLVGLCYMIWCPVAHTGISAQTPEAHKDSSGVPLSIRNVGKIHYPDEGFDVKGATGVEIAFRPPEVLGISDEMIGNSSLATFQIATCQTRSPRFPINVFFHAVREVDGGIEFRSHYWLLNTVKKGKARRSAWKVPKIKLLDTARSNCIHSLTEYNNLASFLPQIYQEEKGKIL